MRFNRGSWLRIFIRASLRAGPTITLSPIGLSIAPWKGYVDDGGTLQAEDRPWPSPLFAARLTFGVVGRMVAVSHSRYLGTGAWYSQRRTATSTAAIAESRARYHRPAWVSVFFWAQPRGLGWFKLGGMWTWWSNRYLVSRCLFLARENRLS